MESTLEDALNEDDGSSENRITAKDEPALQVELQWTDGHAYGFLKFPPEDLGSHLVNGCSSLLPFA